MILTPEQIEEMLVDPGVQWEIGTDAIETIRSYADIVEKVAEEQYWWNEWCKFCEAFVHSDYDSGGNKHIDHCDHEPDCLYLAARKLRGKE